MGQPEVSIIIPVKDRPKELERAIKSALAQTMTAFELLVIDDGSVTDLAEVVEKFEDERLTFLRNDKGVHNANVCRNIGLDRASGKYVAMLDSDDEWMPNHLAHRIEFLSKEKVDGCFGSFVIDDGSSVINRISRDLHPNESFSDYLLTDGAAQTSSHFCIKEAASSIGWDEDLHRHQDYDFSIRFAKRYHFVPCKERSVIIHRPLGEKPRKHADSMVSFIRKHSSSITEEVLRKYLLNRFSEYWSEGKKEEARKFQELATELKVPLSLSDFSQLNPSSNILQKVFNRLRYNNYQPKRP